LQKRERTGKGKSWGIGGEEYPQEKGGVDHQRKEEEANTDLAYVALGVLDRQEREGEKRPNRGSIVKGGGMTPLKRTSSLIVGTTQKTCQTLLSVRRSQQTENPQ